MVDFKDSRIALYSGSKSLTAATAEAAEADPEKANPLDMYLQRQPTLRINWRPDVQRLGGPNSAAQILSYLSEFLDTQHPDIRDDESMAVIGGLLELAGHKTPRMRVLEIGGDEQGYKANLWQTMLGKKTAYSRVRSWHTGTVDVKGDISVEDGSEELFDAVLVPKVSDNLVHTETGPRRGHFSNCVSCNSTLSRPSSRPGTRLGRPLLRMVLSSPESRRLPSRASRRLGSTS